MNWFTALAAGFWLGAIVAGVIGGFLYLASIAWEFAAGIVFAGLGVGAWTRVKQQRQQRGGAHES